MPSYQADTVFTPVIPSFLGYAAKLTKGTSLASATAGKKAGDSFANNFVTRASKAKVNLKTVSDRAAAQVAASSKKVAAARETEEAAARKVQIAELKLQETRDKGFTTFSELAASEDKLAVARKNLSRATESTRVAEASHADTLVRTGKEMSAAEAAVASSTTRYAKFSRVTTGVGSAAAAAGAGFKSLGSKMSGALGPARSLLPMFAGFEALKFGEQSIENATDFQKSTNLLVTAGGESQKALGLVRNGIQDIAKQTGTASDQLADGMYVIEKAQIHGAAGLKVLKAAAEGAKAENTDLSTMTNALTSIMRSYDLPASQSVKITNQLVAASGAAKTTMQEFAGSLSNVLPVASAAGLSFGQVGGAIATLTTHGTSADEATQELANTIRNLQAPNNVASKTMAQFGISSNSVSQKLGKRGLTGTLTYLSQTILSKMGPSGLVLQKSFNASQVAARDAAMMMSKLPPQAKQVAQSYASGKLSLNDYRKALKALPADQSALVQQWASSENRAKGFNQELKNGTPAAQTYTSAMKKIMGGATGLNTVLQLTGGSSAVFAKNVKDIDAAGNKTGKDISTWASTSKLFGTQLDRLKQTVTVTGTEAATKLLPSLTKFVGWLLTTGTSVASFVSKNKSWIEPLAAGILGLVVAWKTLMPVVEATKVVLAALDIEFDASPIGLVVVGVVALATALYVAYKRSATFRAIVNAVGGALKTAFVDTMHWITGSFVPFFTKTLPAVFTSVKSWISTTWTTVSTDVEKPFLAAWTWLSGPFAGFFTHTLPTFFTGVGKAIAAPFVTAWKAVETGVRAGWSVVEKIFSFAASWVKTVWGIEWKILDVLIVTPLRAAIRVVQDNWAKIKAPFVSAAKWVGSTFKAGWTKATDFIGGVVHTASGRVTAAWTLIRGAFTTANKWISTTFKASWNKVTGWLTGPINTAESWVKAFWTREKTGWSNIAHWVATTFKAGWNKTTSILKVPVVAGENAIKAAWTGAQNAFTGAKNWVTGTWSRGWSAVKDKLTGPVNEAKTIIGTALGSKSPGIQWLFSDAVAGVKKVWADLQNVVKAPIKFIVNTVLDDGLIAGYNKLARFAWGNNSHNLGTISLPRGFDQGGYTGDGPRKKAAGVVHAGEVVFDQPAVAAAGGARRLDAWRQGLKSGLYSGLPGFDGGGIVGGIKNAASSVAGFVGSTVKNIGQALSDPKKLLESIILKAATVGAGILNSPVGQTAMQLPSKLVDGLVNKLKGAAGSILGGIVPKGLSGNAAGALQKYALSLFPAHGWTANMFGALKALWNGESGWNPAAYNAASGATGIPQALPGSKMASAGSDWRTNGDTQIRWGEGYIDQVYGNPVNALAKWLSRSPHWYAKGTKHAKKGVAMVGEEGPELVTFAGGEQVIPAKVTQRLLKSNQTFAKAVQWITSSLKTGLTGTVAQLSSALKSLQSNIGHAFTEAASQDKTQAVNYYTSQVADYKKRLSLVKGGGSSVATLNKQITKTENELAAARKKGHDPKTVQKYAIQLRSEQKELQQAARDKGHETVLTKQLTTAENALAKARKLNTDTVALAGEKQFNQQTKSEQAALASLAKKRASLASQITSATSALNTALSNKSQYATQIRGQVTDTGNLGSLSDITGFSQVTSSLTTGINQWRTYATDLAQLKKWGLSNASYQQLLEAGPADQATVTALLKGGRGGVGQVNKLEGQLTSFGTSLGNTASKTLYQAGVNSAQGLLNGLESKDKALEQSATRIANTLVKQVKKKLGIRSPSRVFRSEVGQQIPAGVVAGIGDGLPDVVRAGASLSAAALQPVGAPAANYSSRDLAGVGAPVSAGEQWFMVQNPFDPDDWRPAMAQEATQAQSAQFRKARYSR